MSYDKVRIFLKRPSYVLKAIARILLTSLFFIRNQLCVGAGTVMMRRLTGTIMIPTDSIKTQTVVIVAGYFVIMARTA